MGELICVLIEIKFYLNDLIKDIPPPYTFLKRKKLNKANVPRLEWYFELNWGFSNEFYGNVF